MGFNIPNPFDMGAPDMPDYKGAANQQTRANRPNQTTPWGSSTWEQDPKTGEWKQKVSLAGPLAGLNDNLQGQAAGAWATPLDTGAAARDKAEGAIYGRAASRLDPMWGQREHDMTTTLANQGIDTNSAAYAKALDNFGRSRNDAYTSALMEAIMGGGQEAQRQQGMDLTSRMAPLSAMSGLQSLTQMPNVPQAGNMLGAAVAQGNYGMDAANYNRAFWEDVIRGGTKAFGATK